MMKNVTTPIGRNKYHDLRRKQFLTEEERVEMKIFETFDAKISEKAKVYFQSLQEMPEPPKEFPKSASFFYKRFKSEFKNLNGHGFDFTGEYLENFKSVCFYFTEDKRFFECENLRTCFNFGKNIKKESRPSFAKGLLLIGNVGNGKTSMMRACQRIVSPFINSQFSYDSAKTVVRDYEALNTPHNKNMFWQKHKKGARYYDDVKKEKHASNYGKVNIFEDLLFFRSDEGRKTFISCNNNAKHPNSIESGLLEFYENYSDTIFDRIFQMFNIIEIKGKSKRGSF